jgi:hypothetical protein
MAISQSFVQSDLAGNWFVVGIASGDDPGETPLAMHLDIDVAVNGDTTGTGTVFFESGTTGVNMNPMTLYLSSAGIITESSDPTGHGILNEDMNLFAFTHTDDGFHLKVGIKPVRNDFLTSELQGNWRGCNVVSGDISLGDTPRYGYGEVTADTQGEIAGTWTSFASGVSSVDPISGVTFSVASDGIVTEASSDLHGVLSEDADILAFIDPVVDDGYSLNFCLRDSGVTDFDVADLQGRWTMHGLVTGDRIVGDTPTWYYGILTFDGSGNFNVNITEPTGTDHDSGSVNLSNRGVITSPGEAVYGYLSDDGNIFIIVSDFGGDGNEFIIGIRGGPDPSSGDGGAGGGSGGGCFISTLSR